jgi:uncharacterized membrane protein YhaH (DUF805 family)
MFGSIQYNLAHLLDFRGRDARQTFWYYVLFLVVVQFAVGLVMWVPLMVGMFRQVFEAASAGVTDQDAVNQMIVSQMGGGMQQMIPYTLGLSAVMILLFVAAFVRRLHDSDKPGWWALLPVATQLCAMYVSYDSLGHMQELMTNAMQNRAAGFEQPGGLSAYSMVGWIGYIAVIVFGVMKSTDGPNRYGDEPVRF